MAIDLHTHYLPEPVADMMRARTSAPFISAGDGGETFHMPNGTLAINAAYHDMDARLEFMDGIGVRAQMLSLAGLFGADSLPAEEALPFCRAFNDHVSELAGRNKSRFAGLASLPFADMDAAVAEYERGRNELGLIGAILPNNFFLTLDWAEKIRPVMDAANRLGGHIFIHPGPRPDQRADLAPGHTPSVRDNAFARAALDVQSMVGHAMVTLLFTDYLDAYPDLSLHVANMGGTLPDVIERIDHVVVTRTPDEPLPSSMARGVHVDCSSLGPRAIEIAVSLFGPEHIVFGTDCPIFRTDWSLKAIDSAQLSETEKEGIRTGNAAQLLAGVWPELGG
ncbi:MAG: amidohydrolase family protein [Rhodospirillaceae bacterium]|jgi:predicted TIM-barrel fold metal-dependent hydrolase|nr:amidohydrolase family protein [Rhodospirillaceae bacterium]MBT3886940.1 amidohydrolase family protein [Rhodospirillaceae bacterium]MBT4116351.1 amidohydrolase family protein [Rhodospirillaceae bacterium]MBT4672311.1 amidohydrolase family protein [Rhodospirillaceae bacterium]MBT4721372.1 amidohydrolase family protein [Rhodospirillaceae bacterium]